MRIIALACVLAALGCRGPTELLLVVQTDLDHDALSYVEIATGSDVGAAIVTDEDAGGTQPCICVSPAACPGEAVDFPLTVPLDPGQQGTVPFRVAARAHKDASCSDAALVENSAVLSFVPHERLGVYLALSAKCIGVTCGDDETCDPKLGGCMPNATVPVPIGHDAIDAAVTDLAVTDLAVSDLSVVHDLAAPVDMTLPPFFLLKTVGNEFDWDVASVGVDFSLIVASDGQASYGPATAGFANATLLPASMDGADYGRVCVASDNGLFFYGVASSSTVYAYEPTAPGQPGDAIGSVTSDAPGSLACAEGSNGVTLAWIAQAPIIGQPSQLKVVRKTGDNVPFTPITIAANNFALAKSGTPTILLNPAVRQGPAPPPTQPLPPSHSPSADMGSASAACRNLELYQLFGEDQGFQPASPTAASPSGPPCVDLDPSHRYSVAPAVGQVVAGGSRDFDLDPLLSIGIPPSFTNPSSDVFSDVAMAPLPDLGGGIVSEEAVAVVYLPTTAFGQAVQPAELFLLRTATTGAVLSQQLLSRTLDPSQRVKIAVNAKGAVLVTWIEQAGANGDVLVGEVVAP